jgi:RimJ/RimL family protein N-acetyltransferase
VVINLKNPQCLWKKNFSGGFVTERLLAVPPEKEAFNELGNFFADGDLYRFIDSLTGGEEGRTWFESSWGKRNYLFMVIKIRENSDIAGFLLFDRHPDDRVFLGGAISPGNRGKGLAGEILRGLKDFLENTRCPETVYAEVRKDNIPAVKALSSAGFSEVLKDDTPKGHVLFMAGPCS